MASLPFISLEVLYTSLCAINSYRGFEIEVEPPVDDHIVVRWYDDSHQDCCGYCDGVAVLRQGAEGGFVFDGSHWVMESVAEVIKHLKSGIWENDDRCDGDEDDEEDSWFVDDDEDDDDDGE